MCRAMLGNRGHQVEPGQLRQRFDPVGHVSEVTLRRARLVLGWVTVRGYIVFIYNQPLRSTQPPTLSGT